MGNENGEWIIRGLAEDDPRALRSPQDVAAEVERRMAALGVEFKVTDDALDFLADAGYDPDCGARPLRRAICSQLEDRAAEALLNGALSAGDRAEARPGPEGLEIARLS